MDKVLASAQKISFMSNPAIARGRVVVLDPGATNIIQDKTPVPHLVLLEGPFWT
jgi:hypothetical protein